MSKFDTAINGIGAVAQLVLLIAEQMGKSTEEVLEDVAADCKARAKDPSDESDEARAEIEKDLPEE